MTKRKRSSWKEMLPSKDLEVCQEHVDGFFRFVHERHEVYHRRFELKQPPPWTDNPWLRDYKFTNVYREIDRGTLWLNDNIIDPALAQGLTSELERELLFQISIYRLLNRIETFEKVGGVPKLTGYDRKRFRKELFEIRDRGEQVFTNAHLTCPTHTKGRAKIDEYLIAVDDLIKKFDKVYDEIKAASGLKDVFLALNQVHCIGAFIAYEICIDLIRSEVVPFDEDNWVNIGPGARIGCDLIFPDRKKTSWEDCVAKLRYSQKEHFKRLGLDFKYLDGKELTLRNIEHSLCEYGKYWKLSNGMGKSRMRFVPTTSTGHDLKDRIDPDYAPQNTANP